MGHLISKGIYQLMKHSINYLFNKFWDTLFSYLFTKLQDTLLATYLPNYGTPYWLPIYQIMGHLTLATCLYQIMGSGQPFSYLFTKIRETLLRLPNRYPFLNYETPYWQGIYQIMEHLIGKGIYHLWDTLSATCCLTCKVLVREFFAGEAMKKQV